ncbi:MAG: AAA family ATPase [Dolichospermum sp. DET50]|nr:AAA family ATPase [Dolichospermum sp. DET66]MBS3034837.1 AAA family ATPase [Dolichospermum sp. DET67]MBS3040040.1 AAA family ATPase [Dolichospermum sp. DET50]QSX67218.1 MAG: AAA family ATPase [Dolichospermum sp. DET69]
MLQRVIINGFKSMKTMDLELRPLNILIGANGAGKSNLISFFKMLNEMMRDKLQEYIGISGYAQSLLYFGPKVTPQIEAQLEFEVENGMDTYNLRLFHAAGDTLIFGEETLSFLQKGWSSPRTDSLGVGHKETKINEAADGGMQTAKALRFLLNYSRVYHFHDTSSTAPVRLAGYIGDTRWLKPDAGNLAALLLRFRDDNNTVYQRIIKTIRLIAPFFDDFVLVPRGNHVILNWLHKGSDQVFGPHQFSDGTLRAICLTTLLLQPEDELPKLIIVDEPELGLHPYALNVVAAMFGKASYHTQILISTQSSSFLDNFNPEDVITVDRVGKESQFKRLNPEELEPWLEEYSLGEVWEKNIMGGGPH